MRSGLEKRIATQLAAEGVSFEYEAYSFECWLPVYKSKCEDCNSENIYKSHWYTPDFFLENGLVVEAKGYFKPIHRKLAQAMKQQHPEIDYRIVFGSDNFLRKGAKKRYSDWCKANEIPYAIKEIPIEWYT